MYNLNETRRYRRIVGSLAGSCLLAAVTLLSSVSEPACLVSLDIVEVVNHVHILILFNFPLILGTIYFCLRDSYNDFSTKILLVFSRFLILKGVNLTIRIPGCFGRG
jgi:hypothetical protein